METSMLNHKGFISYFRGVIAKRENEKLNFSNYVISLKHLERFTHNREIAFNKITPEWFDEIKNYFRNAKGLRCGKLLSVNSANTFFSIIVSIVNEAANNRLVDPVIVNTVTNLQPRTQAKSSALSLEELQQLAKAKCRPLDLKKAFLFSCLTGLQWKDIETLRWNQIHQDSNDLWQITLSRDQDTTIPLSSQARELLGSGGNGDMLVFAIHYSTSLRICLTKWALHAGILRNITFHSARQTFASMLYEQGVQLEIISELLGHKHLKSTMKFLSIENN